MTDKKKNAIIIIGIVFLVVGVLVGLLISNMTSTGEAKGVFSNAEIEPIDNGISNLVIIRHDFNKHGDDEITLLTSNYIGFEPSNLDIDIPYFRSDHSFIIWTSRGERYTFYPD